jgi:hypothetical protein
MMFSTQFPHIAWWVLNNGWVALGSDEDSDSLMRLIDPSGTCWEDEDSDTMDIALYKAEMYLKKALPIRFPNRFSL